MGETVDELREDIRFFIKAFQKPVLKEETENGKPILVPQNDIQKINDGHYFELMDRAGVAVDYIYQFLGCHPIIRKESKLRKVYEQAEKSLAELYQEAGRLEFEILLDKTLNNKILQKEIIKLLNRKKSGEELDHARRIPAISDFIENELERLKNNKPAKSELPGYSDLNEVFRKIIYNSHRTN